MRGAARSSDGARGPFGATLVLLVLAAFAAVAFEVARGGVSQTLLRYAGERLNALASVLEAPHALDGGRLFAFALAGGLVASISPCILAMLPVNLAYVGSAKVRSRAAAVRLATLFVAGVALVNTVLGLAGSLFFAIFVEYRGQVNVAVGVATLIAALWLGGVLRLRLPSAGPAIARFGPLGAGVAFGLATSPCSSPVLFAVLAAAAKSGNPLRSVSAMALYSVGYTAVLWLASAFTGIVAASRHLLPYGELITRASAFALGAIGIGTAAYGISLLR